MIIITFKPKADTEKRVYVPLDMKSEMFGTTQEAVDYLTINKQDVLSIITVTK